MSTTRAPRRARKDRGITLLMTLIIIVALLGLGLTSVWIASMSTNVSGNLASRQAAFNAALAGVQHARLILTASLNAPSTACPSNITAPWTCALAGQTHAKNAIPTASSPNAIGAVLWDASTPMSAVSSPSGGGTQLGSYTVWVRNDVVELNTALASGGSLTLDGNNSVIIRSEGRDLSGTAVVVVEAAVTQLSLATTGSGANSIFGKNIDPYGSNSLTGSFHF